LLHQGGYGIVKGADRVLCFNLPNGQVIPQLISARLSPFVFHNVCE
jgi:hypothetical protein